MTPAEHGQERCENCTSPVDPVSGRSLYEFDATVPIAELREQLERAADRERALVEAGNNVISDLERQGSVTSAHYNALRAALDRIQEGK